MNVHSSRNPMACLRRSSRLIAFALLLGGAPVMLTGCYGRFPLTHAVYDFNGDISDDKVITNVVFWIFAFFPVYGIAMFGDAIIFNLVEFWTGNTLEVGSATAQDGTQVTLTPSQDGSEAVLTLRREGRIVAERRFVKTGTNTFEMRDAQRGVTGMVFVRETGDIDLADAHGRTIRTISAGSIAAMATR